MNRWVLVFSVLSLLCGLFFVNVWQSFRYSTVERQVAKMEAEQMDVFEENKRLIAGIALLESPERLQRIATEQLELEGPYSKAPILIRLARRERAATEPAAGAEEGEEDG